MVNESAENTLNLASTRSKDERAAESEKNHNKVYAYHSNTEIYSIAFSHHSDYPIRLAIGSITEKLDNNIQVVQLCEEEVNFQQRLVFPHKYPASKIMWTPSLETNRPDLLITSSDTLKVFEISDNSKVEMKSELINFQKDLSAPLTSFD